MSKVKRTTAILTSIIIGVFVAFALSNIHGNYAHATGQSNDQPPVVKITAPPNGSMYQWNSLVEYNIVVSDHGKSSKYQEIPSSEVLLKTTYVPDVSHIAASSSQMPESLPAGLQNITGSNCLGCHNFKSKAMGPSFSAIKERYPDTDATISNLSKHIRDGSVGMWGQGAMPSHPELTETELHAISLWIMKHASDPNVNYYVGTEGTFQMESPGKPGAKAGLILTASYTSHGTTGHPQPAPSGEDTVVIQGK